MRRFVIIVVTIVAVVVIVAVWFKFYSANNIEWLVPLSIAVLGLAFSIYNIWETHFVPFELRVYDSGRLEWTKDPRIVSEPMIFVDLIFSNFGARKGVVEQVALALCKAGEPSKLTLFRPIFLMKDRTLHLSKEPTPPELETFVAFEVGALETTVKKIGFVPRVIPSGFVYEKGSYDVKVFLKGTRYKKWKEVVAMCYAIENVDLEQLREITMIPEPDGRFYVNWKTQSKVSESFESSLHQLERELVEGK